MAYSPNASGSAPYTFKVYGATVVIRSVREAAPAHYLLEIESFREVDDSEVEVVNPFESTEFDAAGYKWVFVIYPFGNRDDGGKDHISLYLRLKDTLDHGWTVDANIKFFIYDYIRKKYLTIQGPEELTYDDIEKEKGIARALHFNDFTLLSNGFIKNDRCKFGVEVFVVDTSPRTACLSNLNSQKRSVYTWKIEKFSKLPEVQSSNVSTLEGRQWNLRIYQRGFRSGYKKSLSLYLNLMSFSDLTNGKKLFVEVSLSVKNQLNGEDAFSSSRAWYSKAYHSTGNSNLLSLSDLHNASKGFKMDDQVIVEVEWAPIMLMKDV